MKPEIVELPHRRTDAPARGRVRAAGAARRGCGSKFVPCSLAVRSDRRLLRRLLQNLVSNAIKYTPQGPRAGRLPARGAAAAHRRLRHRPRHSGVEEARDLPRVPSSRAGRQGGARARPRPLDRRADRARARPQGRRSIRRSAAARVSRSTCRSRRPLPVEHAAARATRRRSRAARRHRGAVHRQRAYDPRRHGDAARRLGLPRAQGAGSRGRDRRRWRRPSVRPTACWSTITSTTATASRRSPRCATASAPTCPRS